MCPGKTMNENNEYRPLSPPDWRRVSRQRTRRGGRVDGVGGIGRFT
jgi:hypothetical protein